MTTFITRLDTSGSGTRVAVKDLIDMEGLVTTAACRVVADDAEPARRDAECMAGIRAAEQAKEARVVGKANLHELAFGPTGINPVFGTPVNPLGSDLVPGGSSSGSAVAVATDEADVALGSDTGGSVRIPSACCGTTGLKTTHGRVSLQGVWPLAPSLDTIGPMARDVAGVELAMSLLEPGFEAAKDVPRQVGRFRPPDVDPVIDDAIDRSLRAAEVNVVEIELPTWQAAYGAGGVMIMAEAWPRLGYLLDRRPLLGEDVAARIAMAESIDADAVAQADQVRRLWKAELDSVFERVEVLALPTMPVLPPSFENVRDVQMTLCTMPFNLSGSPALALPVPTGGLPGSLQLVGPDHAEERLLALARVVESAV
jgi:amidase